METSQGVSFATAMEAAVTTREQTPRYARRLGLTGRCFGAARAMQTPIDIGGVLSNAAALQEMTDDLVSPFASMHIDMVVAVYSEPRSSWKDANGVVHRFTAPIAGAMAATQRAAFGEVTVLEDSVQQQQRVGQATIPAQTKRGRPLKKARADPASAVDAATRHGSDDSCHRVASLVSRESGLSVELKRDLIAPGMRVLLVLDWIDSVDAVVAARDVVLQLGGDVVGVSIVVASRTDLLCELNRRQIQYRCSWSPAAGAHLTVERTIPGVSACLCDHAPRRFGASSRERTRDKEREIELVHDTSHYEANAPGEDRSVNAVKPSDPDVKIFAIFDGHGGSIAVEHVKRRLCQAILSAVTSECSPERVEHILASSFIKCDDQLKEYLESLPLETRMSKGFCNTGSCAVIALFIKDVVYVANVGDCSAILGRRDAIAGRVRAQELSTEHNCKNAAEVRLVTERCRDRNPIRLSKDEQTNGVGNVGIGLKRVAGSLAVTRAFGDFYLKSEELSLAPFKSKLPYITVEPSISRHQLTDAEQYLILASDGLWEVITSEEAIEIVDKFDARQSLFFSSSSAALVHAALEKVAHRDGYMVHDVLGLRPGHERRRVHDDIACTVIHIRSRPRIASNAETEQRGSGVNVIPHDNESAEN